MSQVNIKHVANLNNDCLRGVEFYKEELCILQERLEEIAADNTSRQVAEKVEHFQNQFIIHKNALNELDRQIHHNNKDIGFQLLKNGVFIDSDASDEKQLINERYFTEEKMFNELRLEFSRFAAQWM